MTTLPTTIIAPGEVTGTDPENRVVNIRWYGLPGEAQRVIVVSDSGDFSFPKIGDVGLVIQQRAQTYYLGKIEYGYKQKLDGEVANPDDPQEMLSVKKVQEGEVMLANIFKNVWLSMNNAGDFSLMDGSLNGLRYYAVSQLTQLQGMLVKLLGNGVTVKAGSVLRNILGEVNFPVAEVPLFPAVEFMVEVLFQTLQIARFHIGHIKNSLGIDEFSTFGGRLRAVLETAQGLPGSPLVSASMKFDELGNIEIASTIGKVSIDSTIPTGSILLGGLGAIQKAVLGDLLLTWLNTHTHSTGVGPSGPPITPAPASLLSLKVMVSP